MKLILFSITLLLTACDPSVDEVKPATQSVTADAVENDPTPFYSYKHDLFIATDGSLAYKTIDNSDPSNPHDHFITSINTDTLNYDQKQELNEVIDTASFKYVGDLYYSDKNHVYYHFQMMDGGTFFIVWEADPTSFQVLDSSYYSRDKKRVFCRGNLIEQADAKTFSVIPQPDRIVYSWQARDKNYKYDGKDVVGKATDK